MTDSTSVFIEPTIIQGDARELSLPDSSVDLVVTSPPYFGLRSYLDGGEHYHGQLGAERTPVEYLDNLVDCTREMIRVLKPSGSLFINLGDRYSQRAVMNQSSHQDGLFPGRTDARKDWVRDRRAGLTRMPYDNIIDAETGFFVREKSLIGLPWRYALRCIDELGLILRAELIWSKPSGMPESVRDRVRRSHETWFHFTVNPRYYSAIDDIREPHTTAHRSGRRASYQPGSTSSYTHQHGHQTKTGSTAGLPLHPRGRLPGSVWDIAPQPLRVPDHLGIEHYAAFPMEWPRRLILGWSPHRVCTACGQGRHQTPTAHGLDTSRPQTRRALELARENGLTDAHLSALRSAGLSDTPRATTTQSGGLARNDPDIQHLATEARAVLGSYAREFLLSRATEFTETCGCATADATTTPGVVLDPFGGTGTTVLVAAVHGRRGLSVDASYDYCRLATWRVHDTQQQQRARGATSPAPAGTGEQVPVPEQDAA